MKERFGQWITNNTAAPFYARKEFVLKKGIRSAAVKVCGLGQFHLYINGQKVGDHELDPGWTNYRKIIQYVTFNVTSYLHSGRNAIGTEVGNGWYIKQDEHYTFRFPSFMPPNPNPYIPFGKFLVLMLGLEIQYADGTTEQISTDNSFQVKEHPVVMSNVYGSELTDGRLKQPGFANPGFSAEGWKNAVVCAPEDEPKGRLTEQFQPPIKVIHNYQGRYLHSCNGRKIYDFGQNMSGILEFQVKGRAGDRISIYPAEKLRGNGDIDQTAKGWTTVDSCIGYIVGEDEVWETCRMKFTYFAGRFIAVESTGIAEGHGFTAHAVSSAFKADGIFSGSDDRFQKIYNLVEKAVEANMLSVHTDCPTIERFAWQEPNHLMAPSIFYMKDGRKLWEKFLLDMRTDQYTDEDYYYDMDRKKIYPGDGLIPSQCPCYMPNTLPVPGVGSFYDIIPWGSACILGVYWHYMFYGDKKIIRDNYEMGMRYLSYLKTKVNADGFINHGLGDWGNPREEYLRENVETVFLYADAITLAKFADILSGEHNGEKYGKDKIELEQYAESVKDNYNQKLLERHPENDRWYYRAWNHPQEGFMAQSGQALPLYWGMVPKEMEKDIVESFRESLEREGAFISGEIGLPYIIQCARKYGMNDLITRFILREEHPSYYAFVLDGETTLGEYWESNPRSHCHDMMGHIVEWYYNGIAGIIPESPGFSKVLIRPYLPSCMEDFTCSYESVHGRIQVEVSSEEETVTVRLSIPQAVQYRFDASELQKTGKEVRFQVETENARNPILPLSCHIPDGEAHVMPDGRLYLYGSYDDREDVYCSDTYHVVSTPDMVHWTIHQDSLKGEKIPWFQNPHAPKYQGIDWSHPTPFVKKMLENMAADGKDMKAAFEEKSEEKPPLLFAPDCACKDGMYYLYFCMSDDSEGVAVSSCPQGPFKDPVQLPCGGIDPAVFVDDDGQVYFYWGQLFSHGVKLNEDMVSFEEGAVVHDLVTEEEHFFHEGSSMRKIGNTYYYLYANMERGKPTSLGDATGESPLGPFTYRGIIIDNDGCDPASWNNHGSMECVNGKWYVFYHRCSRGVQQHRRLCVEPITIHPDGTIDEVKMTSQGAGAPFSAGEQLMGYQACGLKGSIYIGTDEEYGEKLTNIHPGDEAVFRYIKTQSPDISMEIKGAGTGSVEVLLNGRSAGKINIRDGEQTEDKLTAEPGEYELLLRFTESENLEVMYITFSD